MDEHNLREAFRDTITKSIPPAPMSTQRAVRTGRHALLRQRLGWVGAATAAATVIAVVSVAASGRYTSMEQPGGPGLMPSVGASDKTARAWPTGPDGSPQEDATARAGKQYEKGVQLLDRLLGVVPAGYTAPDAPGGTGTAPSRSHQASADSRVADQDIWRYTATVEVVKGTGTGALVIEVHAPVPGVAVVEGCALAGQFWGLGSGECQEVTVGAAKVGVVVKPAPGDDRLDQWAAYRYPDGTVVYVAQTKLAWANDTAKPLAALPFTVQQLAALAADDRFHLT